MGKCEQKYMVHGEYGSHNFSLPIIISVLNRSHNGQAPFFFANLILIIILR